jgi:hypothetical protein
MLLWFVVALQGCTHARPVQPKGPPEAAQALPGPDSVDVARAREALDEVSAVRRLAVKAPVPVVSVGAKDFGRQLAAKSAREFPHAGAALALEWIAFGFLPSKGASAGGLTLENVGEAATNMLDEQVIGFYDEFQRRLVLRSELPESFATPTMRVWLLAHEAEHALQDQHFPSAMKLTEAGEDEFLARSALLEGDASLAATLVLSTRQLDSPRDAVKRLAALAPLKTGPEMMKTSPSLMRAPLILRARMLFPYMGGMRLTAMLYALGGWPLVDRAYARPPVSTAQVLHPELYLHGVVPEPVPPPAVPAGATALLTGRLGELLTRVLLTRSDDIRLSGPGAGWTGDAYAVVELGPGQLGLLWSTTWRDARAAQAFEAAVRAVGAGWPAAPADSKLYVTADLLVRRDGARVAVVRGLAGPEAEVAAQAMLAQVVPKRPAGVPLAEGLALQRPPSARQAWGEVEGDHYVSEDLGIDLPLPPNVKVQVGERDQELLLTQRDHADFLLISLHSAVTRPGEVARLLDSKAEMLLALVGTPQAPEQHLERGEVAGIPGVWLIGPSGKQDGRLGVLSLCDGQAYLLFDQLTKAGTPSATLTAWLGAYARQFGPEACEALGAGQ